MADRPDDGRFVELLTSSQVRMRSYALTLVRTPADADDIVQNACVALWEKRHEYDANREFFHWACGVVLIEVLRHRRKHATDRLMFDETLITSLAADYLRNVDELDRRREFLHSCVAKLPDEDRRLLTERYQLNTKPKDIAAQRGRPATTIYSALARIRESLHRCIETSLARDAHPHPGR